MCQIMQDFKNKGEIEKAKDMAIKLADMGVSVEKIAKAADCDTKTVKGWLDKKESMNCRLSVKDESLSKNSFREAFLCILLRILSGNCKSKSDTSLKSFLNFEIGIEFLCRFFVFRRKMKRDCRKTQKLFSQLHLRLFHLSPLFYFLGQIDDRRYLEPISQISSIITSFVRFWKISRFIYNERNMISEIGSEVGMDFEKIEKLPPLTRMLLQKAMGNPVSFATPGHHAGDFYRMTETGRIFCEALSENLFAADISDSDEKIGNILSHTGLGAEAEALAARVFHAERTYFVLGGTSAANRICVSALLSPGDLVLFAGHNHQSMGQALAETGATPVFLPVLRNEDGLIVGPSPSMFSEKTLRNAAARIFAKKAKKKRPFRLACLPLVTYDGFYVSPRKILETAGTLCDYVLFDAAWGGYEAFISAMKDFSPLLAELSEDAPGILVTQSVHKQLAGFTQTSAIHVRDGHLAGKKRRLLPDVWEAAFASHSSTSPSAILFAGLEMNAAIHEEAGDALWEKAVQMGAHLLEVMRSRLHLFTPVSAEGLPAEMEDVYRVDPCKLFLLTAKAGVHGAVLNAYLQSRGIVPEKSSPEGVLFLISPADTTEKYEILLQALCDFEAAYESGVKGKEILPEMSDEDFREGPISVSCAVLLDWLTLHDFWDVETSCLSAVPQMKMTARKARDIFVSGRAKLVPLEKAVGHVAVEAATAYPPGIPFMYPGAVWSKETVRYFRILTNFNAAFPDFATEIYGVHEGKVWVIKN